MGLLSPRGRPTLDMAGLERSGFLAATQALACKAAADTPTPPEADQPPIPAFRIVPLQTLPGWGYHCGQQRNADQAVTLYHLQHTAAPYPPLRGQAKPSAFHATCLANYDRPATPANYDRQTTPAHYDHQTSRPAYQTSYVRPVTQAFTPVFVPSYEVKIHGCPAKTEGCDLEEEILRELVRVHGIICSHNGVPLPSTYLAAQTLARVQAATIRLGHPPSQTWVLPCGAATPPPATMVPSH